MDEGQLPSAFLRELEGLLDQDSQQEYLRSFVKPPRRCAWSSEDLSFQFERCEWSQFAWRIPLDFAVIEDPLWHAGVYSCQDAAAMTPVNDLLSHGSFLRILDLCAAPGGKSVQLLQALGNNGLLVSNEVIQSRARILLQNLERSGATNSLITSMDPERLSSHFPAFFDCVVVDAPCSGEGMFRKYPQTREEYSEQSVTHCAARQKRILTAAIDSLAEGGLLLYSTCTYNRSENEEVLEHFSHKLDLLHSKRLWPHEFEGEGQCYFLLKKKGDLPYFFRESSQASSGDNEKQLKAVGLENFLTQDSIQKLKQLGEFQKKGKLVSFVPTSLRLLPGNLKKGVVRASVPLIELLEGRKRQEKIPHHALSHLPGRESDFKSSISLDQREALYYLKGESIRIDSTLENGFAAVSYNGFVLGWGKYHQQSGVLKNHYPKGLRIQKTLKFE